MCSIPGNCIGDKIDSRYQVNELLLSEICGKFK